MKMTKKIMSLAIVFAMVMAMSVSVFAAPATDGKITVTNAVVGQTYSLYRIFDLQSYVANSNYAYTVNSAWTNFINSDAAKAYVTVETTNNTVSWVEGADPQEFAKLALAYAKANNIAVVASDEAEAVNAGDITSTVEFANLTLGYYLVDSTMGALCALTTTDKVVEVIDKNTYPGLAKKVQEDSTSAWGDTAVAETNTNVNYQLTVNTGSVNNENLGTGVDANYVIVDALPAGITYVSTTSVVADGTPWTADDQYTVSYDAVKNEVTFTLIAEDVLALGQEKNIVIEYKTLVGTDAAKVVIAGNGNQNTATLTYNNKVVTDTATVFTYQADVFKYTGNQVALEGAKFVLKNAAGKFAKVENEVLTGWVDEADATVFITEDDCIFSIKGLDNDENYFLKEIEAPAGYNLLTSEVTVRIDGTTPVNLTGDKQIEVENKTGTELPSTGGIGTTIFYALGGLMAVGAGVLLVAKKRMEA
ncbi:MAG: isopeptide-forming domain-containing fimbrial protein [Clostridia bacterium]|nr:isopeptide-forming domain-containing fimbrial protein [Clostridia bacterium]